MESQRRKNRTELFPVNPKKTLNCTQREKKGAGPPGTMRRASSEITDLSSHCFYKNKKGGNDILSTQFHNASKGL